MQVGVAESGALLLLPDREEYNRPGALDRVTSRLRISRSLGSSPFSELRMGRGIPVLLRLLCLLCGSLLPGAAQEQSTNQNVLVLSESPVAWDVTLSPLGAQTTHDVTWTSSQSEHRISMQGPQDKTVTEQPVSYVPHSTTEVSEAISSVTTALVENVTGSKATAFDLNGTVSEQSSMDGEGTTSYLTQSATYPTTTARMQGTAETLDSITEMSLQSTPASPLPSTEPPADTTHTTAASPSYTIWMAAITTSAFITRNTATTTSVTRNTVAPLTPRAEVQNGPSVLDVGDDENGLPSYYPQNSSNALFVMILSVFTIMIVIGVVFVGFIRYRKRNNRAEFRRLQDLPMDDLMEDTPLSLYSY